MTSTPVEALCARLRDERDVLVRHKGVLSAEPLPRSSDGDGCAWWITSCQIPRNQGVSTNLQDVAEAVALLSALARVDVGAFLDVAQDIWPGGSTLSNTGTISPSDRGVGLSYVVRDCDSFIPIAERVFGVRAPSDRFVDDCKRLGTERSAHDCGIALAPSPIPVRLELHLRDDPGEFAYFLRQLVQNAIAQRLLMQATTLPSLQEDAVVRSRFEIQEVVIGEESTTDATAEALEYLAKLVELGVRIEHLPSLNSLHVTTLPRVSVAKSLQMLLPRDTITRSSITYVPVDDNHRDPTTALLSAVQVSRHVEKVTVMLHSNPFRVDEDDVDNDEEEDAFHAHDVDATLNLWRWVAYSLFSRHASNTVQHVVLSVDYMEERSLSAMERVLTAENPLKALFTTSFKEDHWISASRFHVNDPHAEKTDIEAGRLCTSRALCVRVIDRSEVNGIMWWRVLLPGCGEAWVSDKDATLVPSESVAADAPVFTDCRKHITVSRFRPSRQDIALSLLQLISDRVHSIDVTTEGISADEEMFDATDWTINVLCACPHLEKLRLPVNVKIPVLRPFIDVAEAGCFHLRSLSFGAMFGAVDVLEFFEVLCDANHPLTRRLEYLELAVDDEEVEPKEVFQAAWQRMLRQNRKLHTIILILASLHWEEESHEPVAIRTGPLSMAAKLAFLSVVQSGRTQQGLDTNMLSVIFAFAAEYRLRNVEVVEV